MTGINFLETLQQKEAELKKQLEAVRMTLHLFQNGNSIEQSKPNKNAVDIPQSYAEAKSWKGKIFYALTALGGSGFVSDMLDELKKNGEKDENGSLFKNVRSYAWLYRKKKILGGKQIGNKTQYFIKK